MENPMSLLPDALVESAKAVILLTEYQTVLHYRDGSGVVTRPVSFESVRSAFSDLPSDHGWLDTRVRRVGSTRGKPFVVAEIPGATRGIFIEAEGGDPLRFTVPMPPLVFFGSSTGWHVWALAAERFAPDAEAFHAPLPNIGPSGSICWGDNRAPKVDPRSMDAALELFWSAPFSSHEAAGRSVGHADDVRKLLADLNGKPEFPREQLVGCGRTIGTLVDSLVGRAR